MPMIGKKILALACALATLPMVRPAFAQDAKTYTMKLGSLTLNDEAHEWLKMFLAGTEQRSKGQITGEIFPSGQLGSAPREIEGTQFGSIQAIVMPPDFFAGIDERFETASAPGTFTSVEEATRVANDPEFRKAFLSLGAEKGLKGLALFVNTPVSILMRSPVHHLADFKGTKIRILASDFQKQQILRLDATPVAMSLTDVLAALQQGAIDGTLASVSDFTPLHYYDAAKYMIQTGHYYVFIEAAMSKKWFDALPPDLQKAVEASADDASANILPWQLKAMDEQAKVWTDHGGQLVNLPVDEEAELMKRMSTIADDVGQTRPAIKEMYDLLKAAVKRAG
jgi:TRAP-type transport system periplasmic protein